MDLPGKTAIPYKSLSIGNHSFELEVGEGFFGTFEHSPVKEGKADISVDVRRAATGMELTVRIAAQAEVECDRCLELLTLPVTYQGELSVRADDTRATEYDGEVLWIESGQAEVDLGQYIYESVCLALPLSRVHGRDADGVSLCEAEMLRRFSIISQEEFEAIERQREENNGLRKQLEQLKDNL